MDERSPRQPDSSGPPAESDENPARDRPENPYRIPQRPSGTRATDAGNFGYGHPRPADPPAPPEPDAAGEASPSAPQPVRYDAPPAHDSWTGPARDDVPQPEWSPPAPEPGTGTGPAEAWDDPYREASPYQGDTPSPGGPPSTDDRYGHDAYGNEAAAGAPPERPADGFEYLYGGGAPGPGGPGGPDGPGNPEDPYSADSYDPGPPPPRKSRRGLLIGVISAVVVLVLVGGGVSWYVLNMPQPEDATAEYVAAWEAQDYERMAAVTTGGDAAAVLSGIDSGLGVEAVDVEAGSPTTDGGTGSAPYEITVSLTNADDWGWEGELPLIREDGQWWVDFSPEAAYPGLGDGQVLARTAVWGERGQILAADGTRIDSTDVSGSLQMIAGSLGEADEDDIERLGPAYSVGDTIGAAGLQRTHEERLAGEAATTILMVDAEAAEDPDSLEATEDNTVAALDGSDGEDIVTSIDMGMQDAAANAIIESEDPAGLVAVRPSTGEILATVNVPGGFNRAFEGQYAPGSSFKIISYSALLDNGMGTDATMDCPKEYELGGWPFVNAHEGEYGAQSVTDAFSTSCNTALVREVGERLSSETLQASAEQFGMNAPLDIGVPTHEPSFPAVDSATMLGAQSIGQGQVLTSPLHMATVPAAIADGSWRQPVLVTDPAGEDLPEPRAIANAEAIRPMMRAVVTEGTAKDSGFQGEVFGKTGSAEYGTLEDDEDELPTHAWMVGYKGDVAFAVVVDGGGGGGSVAGPLAAAFANTI